MAASVLFDSPGPATRTRHGIYTIVTIGALILLAAFAIYRLFATGQFDYDKWEVFITPKYDIALLNDWGATISMALLAVPAAVVFGIVFGIAKLSDHSWVRTPAWLVVEFFRAVPVIMLMILFFYTLYDDLPIERGAFWAAVTGLMFYNGAVLAEVVRAGINAVPKGQAEAAYAVGMRKSQVMNIILLPQAIKIMIPAMISQMVVAVKDTSLILIVLPVGLTRFHKQIASEFSNHVATILVVSACYIITNLVLTLIANYVQKKFVGEKQVLQVSMVAGGGEDAPATVR